MAQLATPALAAELQFSPPTRDQHGNMFGFCQGRVNGRVLMQLSDKGLVVPFGVSAWDGQRSTMTLCVPADAAQLREFLEAMDEKAKRWAWENRQQLWRNPPASKDILDAFHKPLIRPAKDASFEDTLQLKIGTDAKYWNRDKTQADVSSVAKGCLVVPLVSASRLWTTQAHEFGITMTMHHALVLEAPTQDPAKLFASFG